MKIKDYKVLPEFIVTLFDFFEKYNITSCMHPIDDLPGLKNLILNSSLREWNYNANIGGYHLTLHPEIEPDAEAVYMFIFKENESGFGNHLMVEQYKTGGKMLILLDISIDQPELLPIAYDLIDENGLFGVTFIGKKTDEHGKDESAEQTEMIELEKADVLTMAEFNSLLLKNTYRGKMKIVEVD